MNKRLIIILALALVVGLTVGAYAEVQNVKVSGDIYAAGVARKAFDLSKGGAGYTNGAQNNNNESDVLSISRIRVDADLTDNVSATVRLLNERNWNGEDQTGVNANANIGLSAANTNEDKINLDLAYVTLKEFLYSPLTLKIGRQELRFGNGLIVGDPDTNIYSASTALAEGDMSARKSFDAVRATFDYNPLVVDLVYAKIQEGNVNLNDDVTLAGLNAAYELDKNTTLEGYFFSKVKGAQAAAVYNVDAAIVDPLNATTSFRGAAGGNDNQQTRNLSDKVNVLGIRAANKTVNNLTLSGEFAYQFGTYNPKFDPNARFISAGNKATALNRRAYALQVGANYDLKDVKSLAKYMPVIGANYTYLSGANRDKIGDGRYKGWDPMFEDQTSGHIMNAIIAGTNTHNLRLSSGAKLTDDIGVKLDYVMAWWAKKYNNNDLSILSGVAGSTAATSGRIFKMADHRFVGQEVDVTLTYDYTEDVQFALLGGGFLPGKSIYGAATSSSDEVKRANAGELIGSMKVTF